jgi:hypothetical protein
MRTVIAIFFFVCAAAMLVLPWQGKSGGRIGWPVKIGAAVLCVLAGLGALFASDSE